MLVVFDLDGTLIDSTQSLLAAHDLAWAKIGRPRPPAEAILELVGLPLIDTMKTLDPAADADALARAYSEAYADTSKKYERLFDGVEQLLSMPFRAAVATGKSQRGAERAVSQHGLADRFEMVLGGNAVPRPKPYPDMLFAIREHTGVDHLVMVGDTTYDLEMAHAAKAKAVGVAWGHHSVDRLSEFGPVASNMDELRGLLGL